MNKITHIIILLLISISSFSQEMLRLNDAVQITLDNGYDIKVAENNSEVALNNSSIYANRFLPQVVGRSGSSYRNQGVDTDYTNGVSTGVNGSSALSYNASIALNYMLFDGMYRSYNYEKSKELYNLSQLQVRQVIEATLLNLFTSYYTVASLTETTESLDETLEISKTRLLRIKYGAEYGNNTQLDVLNAEVDVNTDSVNLLNSRQGLNNSKRNLNVLMGRSVAKAFIIDTTVHYEVLYAIDTLLEKAKQENIRLLTAQKSLELTEFNTKLLKTNRIPTIGLSGSYAWSNTNYNMNNQIDVLNILGPQAEVSLAWNIFDGGQTKTGVQNAKIATETSTVQQEQIQQQVDRDVINAYTTYSNSIFVMQAEKANLATSNRNFDRTEERYQLGQLTSIEFRQAQLNLLRAQTRYNQSKYQAKIYELALFKLTGDILNMKF